LIERTWALFWKEAGHETGFFDLFEEKKTQDFVDGANEFVERWGSGLRPGTGRSESGLHG
jgi:hypothetical protein